MSKLLQTQLPIASDTVTPDLFNRLVRILEINLGAVDTDNIRQINETDKNTLQFNAGSIIWNTSIDVLQVYTGNRWLDIEKRGLDTGYEMQAELGKITVTTDGNVSVNVTDNITGYGVERWYS
tara:strand:+ start:1167 stop:1535 length:369 start_codon:yes stop_codon:yes gene_type:complete